MKRALIAALAVATALAILPGCKPTEKNYKEAYSIAQGKVKKDVVDPDLGELSIEPEDAPRWHRVGNDSVRMASEPVKLFAGDDAIDNRPGSDYAGQANSDMMPYNVVIGLYRMPTNAKSQAERFRAQGNNAAVLQTLHDMYYVAGARFQTVEEGVTWLKKYQKKNPDTYYPGLPYGPFILSPSK